MLEVNLKKLFGTNYLVETVHGKGRTFIHQAANLVLPSGTISLIENLGMLDFTNTNHYMLPITVAPSSYSVFATLARRKNQSNLVAYITVQFSSNQPVFWKKVEDWFTDHGFCILCDSSIAFLAHSMLPNLLGSQKSTLQRSITNGGDGSAIIDQTTKANMLVFRCGDYSFPVYVGFDNSNVPCYLVVDTTIKDYKESVLDRLYRHFLDKFG